MITLRDELFAAMDVAVSRGIITSRQRQHVKRHISQTDLIMRSSTCYNHDRWLKSEDEKHRIVSLLTIECWEDGKEELLS